VLDSPIETIRTRRVVLTYFLEDGTLQITEPSIPNSGLLQGLHLRRHRVSLSTGAFIRPEDLKCGEDICLYSRVYRVCKMDDATEKYYDSHGIAKGTPERIPESLVSADGSESAKLSMESPRGTLANGRSINRRTKQYLECDGKLLCFNLLWRDDSEGGFDHLFELHWFLADDTMELIEIFPKTPSCAACRVTFVKRTQVKTLDPKLTHADFLVGNNVTILNREMLVTDCDSFTRDYFHRERGIEQPVHSLESREDGPGPKSVEPLVPRRPRVDPARLEKAGIVLRFRLELLQGDKDRKFILGYYPADDSIAVWELPIRNSGHVAGKFAERGVKPKADGTTITLCDIVIGHVIKISGVQFRIREPDEFTQKYMGREQP
jgi:hypothetical protein